MTKWFEQTFTKSEGPRSEANQVSRPPLFSFFILLSVHSETLPFVYSLSFFFYIHLEAKAHLEGVVQAEEVSRGIVIVRGGASANAVGRGLTTMSTRGLVELEATRVEVFAHLTQGFD